MLNKVDLNGTLVKADIVDQVYEKVGFTRQEAVLAVEILFEEIKSELSHGNNVRISRFASFILRKKKARNARNPKTGETIRIKPRTVLTFKPSKQLLDTTNQSFYDDNFDS
ncbi:MAG: integration host factor subunit alpha [Nitrospina sp.]|nr:integration host factor subunit alpha [Nitrospina sp.]